MFSNSQFIFGQYEIRKRRDRNKYREGLLKYARKGLISKTLESTSILNSELMRSEIMIEHIKWEIFSVYRPQAILL